MPEQLVDGLTQQALALVSLSRTARVSALVELKVERWVAPPVAARLESELLALMKQRRRLQQLRLVLLAGAGVEGVGRCVPRGAPRSEVLREVHHAETGESIAYPAV
ncbi:adenosylcobinamide amidohydrolase [Babesia caballi]|uniref:Adenosylcobinamide amidohydrolase n=1 Tax=Babesia caballi TaxID=5871 RepID=A0AAV4LPA7_BABCB|nr:adenosylcobinamide amidohydrolase [Babesia caballi]